MQTKENLIVAPIIPINVIQVPLPPPPPAAQQPAEGAQAPQQQAVPAAGAPGQHQQNTENILLTGNAHHLVNYIRAFPQASPEAKMFALFQAYSQILSLGGLNSGICAGDLKMAILEYAKQNPVAAQATIKLSKFEGDDRLASLIRKVDYLTNGIHGNYNIACNYTRRFMHHISETYFNNRRFVGNYSVLGVMLVTTGVINALITDPNDPEEKKKKEGWASIAIGGATLVLYPLIHVAYATFAEEEP